MRRNRNCCSVPLGVCVNDLVAIFQPWLIEERIFIIPTTTTMGPTTGGLFD